MSISEKLKQYLNEGIWAFPKTKKSEQKLMDLVQKMKSGMAGNNWRSKLVSIFGDDQLLDSLDSLKEYQKKDKFDNKKLQSLAASEIINRYNELKKYYSTKG